jgi:hypothetical protein
LTRLETEGIDGESLRVAPVYYEYGNALLHLSEATASVFGKDAVKGEDEDEDQNDLEVAWQMLEISRVLLAKYEGEDARIDKELARVYMRLGDLGMESDLFVQARSDYEKSLAFQKKILVSKDMDTTPLADIYCCMAITCIYEHSKQPEENEEGSSETNEPQRSQAEMELQGMKYYVLAGGVMEENVYRKAKECSSAVRDFVTKHLPRSSTLAPSKGKGKAKLQEQTLEDLKLVYNGAQEDLRKDFIDCALKGRDVTNNTKDDGHELLTEEEKQLLEYLEIYTEVKEKVK